MRPPDQIPNRGFRAFQRGDTAYVWTGRSYSEKTVVTQHDWKSALTLRDGISELIVSPDKVISAEQFCEEQREEARQRYAEIIKHWNNGLRKSNDIGLAIGETARTVGQMIAAAKRWGLISSVISSDDKEAGATNSNQSG